MIAEQRGRVLILTLNRQDRLNAWNDVMMANRKDVKEVFARNATNSNIQDVMDFENGQNAEARQGPEHREAVSAFLEKRTPKFE